MTRRRGLWVGLALAALTLVAYAGVLRNGFIDLDDNQYVTRNARVQAGLSWDGVAWAFRTMHAANWHPLTWLSHMLDFELYGMNPAGHHATSLAIHLANTLLLLRLFLRTTGALWPSAFVAATFALHPLHVESVAWVAERKDVLCALFGLLTTLAYVRWTERKGAGRYALVVLLYALGLASKPMLVTLPWFLLLLDRWPLGRIGPPWREPALLGRLLVEKLPLFALSAACSVATFLAQEAAGAMSLGDHVALPARAENAAVSYVVYLVKAFVPSGLAVFYPYRVEQYAPALVAGALLLLVGISVLAVRSAESRPWIAVGWAWYVGTLVPVIGLVQVGSQARADRYAYLPMIGLSVAVAFGAAELVRSRSALVAAATIAVLSWTVLTIRQVGYWKDDRTLFEHVVAVMPDNYLAHGILGSVHLKQGRLLEAEAELRESVRLRESYAQGHSNLGMTLELAGKPAEALAEYRAALRWMPKLAEAHHNVAGILRRTGEEDRAIEHYEAALRIDPDLAETHHDLAVALLAKGRHAEAREHLEAERRLRGARSAGGEE